MLTVADFKEFKLPTIIQQRFLGTEITSYIADFTEDKKVIVIKKKSGKLLYYFAHNSTDATTPLIDSQFQSLEDLVPFLNLQKPENWKDF